MKPKIIVHGGARNGNANEKERQRDVTQACEKAYDILRKRKAIDAVEFAIKEMESSEYLNAGVGSYLQLDGRVRMDASIMKNDLSAGGVIGIEDIEHPIAVARKVMESTKHVILGGTLATEFARTEGFPRYDPRTKDKVNIWLDIMEEFRTVTTHQQIFHVDRYLSDRKDMFGTVGCVAIDADGNLAAGTSTGGLKMNVPGRVGDSAIIGAGTYCCKSGGVSCTGAGEIILVLSLAKEVTNYLQFNRSKKASDATDYGLKLLNSMKGNGGMICIDRKGSIGYSFSTEVMTVHYIK